jgi:isoleucyl-tRNA synthetase
VQQARRDAGLAVGDRVTVRLATPGEDVAAAAHTHRDLIAGETLADEIVVERVDAVAEAFTPLGDGSLVAVTVSPSGSSSAGSSSAGSSSTSSSGAAG